VDEIQQQSTVITRANVTIVADVIHAYGAEKNKSHQHPGGNRLVTRKNPHVIAAGFGLNITVS